MGRLLGDLFQLGVLIGVPATYLGLIVYTIVLPWLAISVTRHVKGIHRELAQLNETLAGKMTITRSGPLGLS